MSKREDLLARIAHHGERLDGLDPEKDKRVKKRIWQTLGKLKKELAALPAESSVVDDAHSKKRKHAAEGEEEDGAPDASSTMPRKKMKALLKQINGAIAAFAITKQLKEAKKKLRQAMTKGLTPDVHTYTNLLNVHVRCGDLPGATELIETMKSRGVAPSIVTITTLVKGYCEAGRVQEAFALLSSARASSAALKPNTRTINTFLRGCVRFGCVELGLGVLDLLSEGDGPGDVVTFDYLVKLLCQRQSTEQATALILGKTSLLSKAPPSHPTHAAEADFPIEYAFMSLSVCRALCLVHGSHHPSAREWMELTAEALGKSKSASLLTRMKQHGDGDGDTTVDAGKCHVGGVGQEIRRDDASRSKSQSLELFLRHSRAEIEAELSLLRQPMLAFSSASERGAWLTGIFQKVFLFGADSLAGTEAGRGAGGRTVTGQSARRHWCTEEVETKLGFSSALRANGFKQADLDVATDRLDDTFRRSFGPEGHLDFTRIFERPLPVHLELGSGAGEWAVAQALFSRGRANWCCLERRFDRVYQTVSRLVCALSAESSSSSSSSSSSFSSSPRPSPLSSNLAILSGEGGSVLAVLPACSVHHVFVNHPEPPARLTGEGQSEGQHMLTSALFSDLLRVLGAGGRVTVVTDSLPYGVSLCKSLSALVAASMTAAVGAAGAGEKMDGEPPHQQASQGRPRSVLLSVKLDGAAGNITVQHREPLPAAGPAKTPSSSLSSPTHTSPAGGADAGAKSTAKAAGCSSAHIVLLRGDPPHAESAAASSYFDRMWDKGGKKKRYFLLLQKVDLGV